MPKDRAKDNRRDAGQCSDTETTSVYMPPAPGAEEPASHKTTLSSSSRLI
jgi:hypothetical protein